jgi:NADH-quinone oxidoreductase subunit H
MRYDQLMDLGWKKLIPLALAWLMMVAGFMIAAWWGVGITLAVIVCAVLIKRAFSVGDSRQEHVPLIPPVGRRLWNRPELVPLPPEPSED